MTFAIVMGSDATHNNAMHMPAGLAAGYTTGTPDIKWTTGDWAAHPNAVRICQDNTASDVTADVLDVETGAATPVECPGWAKAALANWKKNTRSGQRTPAIYVNDSNIHYVANALVSGGITSGVGLWVANWNNNEPLSAQEVADAAGPFPIVAFQYASHGLYDLDIYGDEWLKNVSGKVPSTSQKPYGITKLPPGQWTGMVTLAGHGSDGSSEWHTTSDNGVTWSQPRM